MPWLNSHWFGDGGDVVASSARADQPSDELRVEELWIYPIKSCRGFSVKQWPFSHEGLLYDRQWMVATESRHRMVTARECPQMLLIVPTLSLATSPPTLTVHLPSIPSHPRAASYTIPIEPPADAPYEADFSIWSSPTTDGYDVGVGPLNAALSAYLGFPACLILKGPSTRTAGEHYLIESRGLPLEYTVEDERTQPQFPSEHESFDRTKGKQAATKWADAFPFLFTTKESERAVQDLVSSPSNAQAFPSYNIEKWSGPYQEFFDPRRFRANVISSGANTAFEEEGWLEVKVGQGSRWATMYPVVRCVRCMVPNTDPDTAERDAVVPWKLMKPTRSVGETTKQGPCFGINTVPQQSSGTLAVGDRLLVISRCPLGADGIWARPEDDNALAAKAAKKVAF